MPQRPVPRRSSGVQVRVRKGPGGSDTRDARDDATIISWLQRIDMDMIRAGTKYAPTSQATPGRRGGASANEHPDVRGLSDAFDQAKRSVREFATTLNPSPIRAAMEGITNSLRRFAGLALPKDVREATIASMQSQKTLADVTTQFKSTRKRQRKLNRIANQAATKYVKAAGRAAGHGPGSIRHRFAQQALQAAQAARDRANEAKARTQTMQTAKGWAQTAANAAQSTLTSTQQSAATPLSAGGLLGGAARAVGSFAVAHPVIAAAAGLAAVGAATAIAVPALWKFATGLFESNKAFAASGPMAFVLAANNIRDTLRDMRTGGQTAGSAGFLGKQIGDIKDLFQPIYAGIRNFLQLTAGVLLAVGKVLVLMSPIYWAARLISAGVQKIVDWLDLNGDLQGESLGEWVQSVADAAKKRHVGGLYPFERPPKMGNVGQ